MTDEHPPRGSSDWANPDLCPFCGTELRDGGAGFMEHIDEESVCYDRFYAWREQIADDIGGEWGG